MHGRICLSVSISNTIKIILKLQTSQQVSCYLLHTTHLLRSKTSKSKTIRYKLFRSVIGIEHYPVSFSIHC